MRTLPNMCDRCEGRKNCEICESGARCGYHSVNKRKFRKQFPINPLTNRDLLSVLRCDRCARCFVVGSSKITEKQMRKIQLRDYYRSIGKPAKVITERMLGKSFGKLVERKRKENTPFPVSDSYEPDYERYLDEKPEWWCEADFLPEYPRDIPEYRRRFPLMYIT